MIGNDIVDIAKAKIDSNWQRPRFLDKIFTSEEQKYIQTSENKFLMVWRLWSMKEAAYKLYTQLNPSRFYNPKGFECSFKSSSGTVKFQEFECKTQTKITSNYIYSEAFLGESQLTSKCFKLKNEDINMQSQQTHSELLKYVSEKFQLKKENLKIIKSKFGIPSIYYNLKALNRGISLTHHGSFGAYAIANINKLP